MFGLAGMMGGGGGGGSSINSSLKNEAAATNKSAVTLGNFAFGDTNVGRGFSPWLIGGIGVLALIGLWIWKH